MSFFHKPNFFSSSSSSPSSVSTKDEKRLTRQRKIRHETQQHLGLQLTHIDSSHSFDSALKSRSPPSSTLPQPLPSPRSLKSPEFSPSTLGHAVPASPRSSADQIATKSINCSRNFRRGSSQDANFESVKHGLRLNIAPRSAPSSGLSSPMVSPRRSSAGEFHPPCATDLSKCSRDCCKGQIGYLNIECVNRKVSMTEFSSSSPASRFLSPTVSPQRFNTGDFLPSFVASQSCQNQSSSDLDLGSRPGHTLGISPVKTMHSADTSPIHSPFLHRKCHSNFSFQLHDKILVGNSKELPETIIHVSAHPLPLPPKAASPQPRIPSPAATLNHMIDRPNVSSRKNQWVKGKLIGRGTYGSVYVGTNRETGALCAMKEVDIIPGDPKSIECMKQLEQEIKFLKDLVHPNIVRYYGCEKVDDHFYIYLENVYPGSISNYVREHCGNMTESIVRNFTRHILSGLAYLHSKKTIHRDIKGANLLVNSSGIVKLADFGMAKPLSGLSYELSMKGSPHWMAPEVIRATMQKDANPDLALAVDIWSLGCTVIEMFTGKPPWGELHGPAAMFKVLNQSPLIPEAMSPEAKDFLSCCFQREPAERPSASKLLEHPFVRNSREVNQSSFCQTASKNSMDTSQSFRECASENIDLVPLSPGMRIMNEKQPNNSARSQQSCATASNHSPCSPSRMVSGSRNLVSSSNFSSNMPLGAVSNHYFLLKSNLKYA
ncbi:mitogen-activated protein kinase kinase kinase 5-like [Mercurialis annua]|uniref:mitogen-activated protein kinase kinase kinase 5-like n=1 Tax=Mercurialis annua TaxID=3986 RepID=UPI00215E5FDB|nr:mitogen-activated protein kinase kinase kinase 5-like [Mercurialis annua]